MAGRRSGSPAPRSRLAKVIATVAAVATVATLAVVANGYDAQEVPRLESSVWVTRDAGQYARVNTDLAEIDTVRAADDPNQVVQAGSDSMVLTQGLRRAWTVDGAAPVDLVEATGDETQVIEGETTPVGTRAVVSSGRVVGYLTDTGEAYVSTLSPEGATAGAVAVDPLAEEAPEDGAEQPAEDADADDEEAASYVATAMAVADDGRVAVFSAAEGAVRVFDATTGEFTGGPAELEESPGADARVEMAIVGENWVLSEPGESRVWVRGRTAPLTTELPDDARLQASTSSDQPIYLASSEGLTEIDPSTGTAATVAEVGGTPAAPVTVGDVVYAAWLTPTAGALWSSDTEELVGLELDGDELEQVQAIVPVLQSNGQRAVLNETGSGMLWTLPDGRLIPLAQWSVDDEDEQDVGEVEVEDVAEQEPPVAVDDAFGVRAGAQVRLPVLLNDHDPNKRDVLTIAADTVSALSDPAFGEVSLASNNQEAVVRVSATSGSATFTYSVTDGQAVSEAATVTLTVVPDDVNTAPEWCGVEACVQEWPTPSIAPGGTVTVPVLSGWVDPEGDLFVLSDAQAADAEAPLSVVATASGEVAVRHLDPNASDATLPVVVTVMDSRGATAERELVISVSSNPVLEAKPIAIVAGVGEKASVPVTRHVTGGSGALRLLDAVESSTTGGALSVVPNAASGEVDLVASEPGEYLVTYTVQDAQTQAEQSALVRLTAVAGGAPLSMAPQAAFVRPNEDTTVDVLSAVQNTGGRVLLVAEASTGDPTLSVDVVGQSRVRVSGTTDDGRPGRVGEAQVTVADGSGASVEGSLTVFLVAASSGVAPIAVPDSVTVRAENQIDIPVTANDVSPRGERLIVHPTVEGSGAAGELVFAAGSRLRYLAPSEPGVYTVRYSVYLENSPTRIDTTTVTVTVVAAGSNRAPQPSVLTARVLSGQTVSIAVPSSGSDPDGDRVVLSEVTQPDAGQGVASISAEGDAILYTAPAGGVEGGQLSFGYTVRDPDGAEGSAEVRVGVLSRVLSDTAPIAYSDYVRVQVGSDAPVRVAPMRNDRDPAQGTLELVSLVPNAPTSEGNPEYARLEGLVDAETSLADGEVVLRGGDVLGAHSYIYTVRSTTSSSTSQGLVVVNVTDAPAPDHPVVEDTVLTAKDRRDFATGVDVVSGKVDWASGDVSSLRLSLWQESSRYEVDGFSIRGDLPDRGALVPFTLTGEDSAGAPAIAHGFLRIPAFDDMRVQLRPDLDPVEVGEEKSVDFQVGEILDLDRADSIEVRSEGPFAVQRANARCTPASGLTVRYDAGRESPWSDSCTVSVRLDGQSRWSPLAVPIAVEPKDPQAILNSVSRTVAPGASEDLDMLASMTTWEGGREGDAARLDFSVSHGGSAFIVTQSGTSVSFEARADARPGTRETVQVSVSSFGGLTAAVTLVVGAAPADSPRGATFRTQCTVSAGSCTIPVVGIGGEYDPFSGRPGSGLKLESVGAGGAAGCTVARVATAGETNVVASWPSGAKPIGGECVVPFTVVDAQGRSGDGRLTIDVQGFPQRPASISTTGYTESSVTLAVPLGEAAQAHPSVTGVTIWEGGRQVSARCAPGGAGAYSCVVSGLENGQRHNYTARAVNPVGDSENTSAVTTWAYRSPEISRVTAEPIYDARVTTTTAAVVRLSIDSADDARTFRIVETGDEFRRSGRTTERDVTVAPGDTTLRIVPTSQFTPPTGDPTNEGAVTTVTVRAAGSPIMTSSGSAASTSRSSLEMSGVELDMNGSALERTLQYVAWEDGRGEPRCDMGRDGRVRISGGTVSDSGRIEGLQEYTRYRVKACGSNGYGFAETSSHEVIVWEAPAAPAAGLTYSIGSELSSRNGQRDQFTYERLNMPDVPRAPRNHSTVWVVNGEDRRGAPGNGDGSFAATAGAPTVGVKYCLTWRSDFCSATTPVAAAGLTNFVTVQFPPPRQQVENPNAGQVAVFGTTEYDVTVTIDGNRATYLLQWRGAILQGIDAQVRDIPPPPEPEPTPDPPESEETEPPANPEPETP